MLDPVQLEEGETPLTIRPVLWGILLVWLCPDFVLTLLVAALLYDSKRALQCMVVLEKMALDFIEKYKVKKQAVDVPKGGDPLVDAAIESFRRRWMRRGNEWGNNIWQKLTA